MAVETRAAPAHLAGAEQDLGGGEPQDAGGLLGAEGGGHCGGVRLRGSAGGRVSTKSRASPRRRFQVRARL